jgi:hypothetical protein
MSKGPLTSTQARRTLMAMYADDTLDSLVEILGRSREGLSVDSSLLERDLGDLFEAVGLSVDDSEEARLFGELVNGKPTHAVLAELFRRLAWARDPFADKADYHVALPGLDAKARVHRARRIRRGELGRPHPLLGVWWADLSVGERADIRQMASELACHHRSFVRRGMPFKNDQNTLLDGLADSFVHFTRFELHGCDLPHAEQSRFIQFAHLALRPLFPTTAVSTKALSRPWKRLKDTHRSGQPSD